MLGGRAEAALDEALGQRLLGFRQLVSHDDALAGGEPVGLHHDRRPVLTQVGQRRSVFREGGSARGRHARGSHDLLGEGLGALEESAIGPGPEHGEPPLPQLVRETGHQRRFRPHDGQIDLLPLHERDQAGDVLGPDVHDEGVVPDAGVTRRAQQPAQAGALAQTAHEGVFPGASADYQDIQPPVRSSHVGPLVC